MAFDRSTILFLALAGAAGLWIWSRTKSGGDQVGEAVGEALELVDVTASVIKNAVTSRGYRNNNPLNMRYIAKNPFNGQIGTDGAFGIYDTPQNGTRAAGKQLLAYEKRGLRTVRDIVATWAPPNENNTSAYVTHVAKQLNVSPDAVIDVRARLADLVRAMARHENGYEDSTYNWQWVYLA